MKKGQGVFPVIGLVVAAVLIIIGLYTFANIYGSILGTTDSDVLNESIEFVSNSSARSLVYGSTYGLQSGSVVIANATLGTLGSGNYTVNNIAATVLLQANCTTYCGNYTASYTYYTAPANTRTAMANVNTTTLSAYTLITVGLIVVAAAAIIAVLFRLRG